MTLADNMRKITIRKILTKLWKQDRDSVEDWFVDHVEEFGNETIRSAEAELQKWDEPSDSTKPDVKGD